MTMITKFEEFQPQLLTFGEPKKGKYGQCYIPIRYNGERLQFTTGKCFSWGLQKDKKGNGYKLPIVLSSSEERSPHQEKFCNSLKSVAEAVGKHVSNGDEKSTDTKKLLSCVYVKDKVSTLYGKVGHNPETDQFYTKFFKVYVEGDEDRSLDPKSIIGNRCTVNAVICTDSIFVSDTHHHTS